MIFSLSKIFSKNCFIKACVLFITFFLFLGVLCCKDRNIHYNKDKIGMLIPLYSCPSDNYGKIWDNIKSASRKVKIAVVWGIICKKDNYVKILKEFGENGILRLAYVATNNSSKNFTEIKEEIDYYSHFPIDGFFFDEVNHNERATSYNRKIIDYSRKKHVTQKVFLNSPYADFKFVNETSADVVVIFENSFKYWDAFAKNYKKFSQKKNAVLIHHASYSNMVQSMEKVHKNIGWFFFTDMGWDKLPSYFRYEIELILNNGRLK